MPECSHFMDFILIMETEYDIIKKRALFPQDRGNFPKGVRYDKQDEMDKAAERIHHGRRAHRNSDRAPHRSVAEDLLSFPQ